MLTCLECAKLRGKNAEARFVEVVQEGVCPDCGRTLSRELMGVRLDAAPKVVLVSSLAIEADIVEGQAAIFVEMAGSLFEYAAAIDDAMADESGPRGAKVRALTNAIVHRGFALHVLSKTMTNHAAALRKAAAE